MRTIKILAVILLSVPALCAQTVTQVKPIESGKVFFTEKISLDIVVEGIPAELLSQIPKERINKTELIFNTQASLYQNLKEEQNEGNEIDAQQEGGVKLKFKMNQEQNILFTDLAKKQSIEKKQFLGKDFLITSSEVNTGNYWKIKADQKIILGYPCQKAVLERDSSEVEAWFTSLIPVSAGPASYGNLPGIILELQDSRAKLHIVATAVVADEAVASLLTVPSGGKKVTEDEFFKIVEEKTKELKQQFGGGSSNVIIKINR
ncbi:MAG: Protein of unknown function, Porph ging [Bacteroidetes bacterium]|nr:Protein of unknown function, Porph ging [Bacteroidota bacterium]